MSKNIRGAISLLALLCALSGCGKEQAGDPNYHILLIGKSRESNFWLTCYQGAEAAVVEYNHLNMVVVAPGEEWDYQAQNDYISGAVKDGVDAIIFSASDYENSTAYVERAMDSGIPVITIDSGVNTQRSISFIGTDNYQAGRMAAQSVAEQIGGEGGVGIVSFEESSANGGQRVQGFVDYMEDFPAITILETRYAPSNYDIAQSHATDLMEAYGDSLKAIATFNELTTIGVGRAVKARGTTGTVCVVGFDNNIESVQMLEEGYIDSLVVQNPFAMGYMGVQQALEEIKGGLAKPNVDTGTVIATKENMYNPEIEKLLIPFSNQ